MVFHNLANYHDNHTAYYSDYTQSEEIIKLDNTNLDSFWIKDESLEDMEKLPAPNVIASEIVENLEFALEQFNSIVEELQENKEPNTNEDKPT